MKKRILSIVLSIVMLVSLLPTTALALETPSHTDHCVCGGSVTAGDHTHDAAASTWKAWNGEDAKPFAAGIQLETGNYYLTGNLTLSDTIRISGTVNLCLNGHSITTSETNAINVSSGTTLNICDCSEEGLGSISTTGDGSEGDVIYNYYGTVNVYGGSISAAGSRGDGIYNIGNGTKGVVNIYGGNISVETSNLYYGIRNKGGIVNVYDGSISALGDSPYGIYSTHSATVSGGTVSGSTSGIHNAKADAILIVSGSASVIGDSYGISSYYGNLQLSGNPGITGGSADIRLDGGNDSTPTIGIDGVLANTEKYTVMTYQTPTTENPVVFTSAVDEGNAVKFESANSEYQVLYADGVLKLAVKPAHTDHPICGATCAHEDGHSTLDSWTAWSGTGTLSGNVYLTGDVTLAETLIISSGTVNLCLNGYSITRSDGYPTIRIEDGATLNLCDCNGSGKNNGSVTNNFDVCVVNDGALTVYGGTVEGPTWGITNRGTLTVYGGSVASTGERGIYNAEGTVYVYGGTVSGNSYGIYNEGGTANVTGGTVTATGSNFYGIYNRSNGTVTVSGGTVTATGSNSWGIYNHSDGTIDVDTTTNVSGTANVSGSFLGIYNSGTLTVSGGTVTATGSNGFGIYNFYHGAGSLELSGAPTITGATAGVYLDGGSITLGGELTYVEEKAISVGMETPGTFTSGWNSNMSGKTPGNYFTSAMDGYTVQPDGSGELKLAEPPAVETHAHDMSVDCGGSGVTFEPWDGTTTFPGGNVYLTKDVTLADTLTISSGTVNMCLNGHSITNSSAAIEVKSGATLNICDCSEGKTGTISATASGSRGIENYGILTVYGGTVSGNTYGICNNYGGNVAVSGGTVSGGTGIENYGTLTVSGGSVTGTYDYGGYGISSYGTFKLSGAPTITGGSNSADVLIHAYQKVITIDGTLTYSTPISVEPYNGYSVFTEGWNDKMPTADHNDYFIPASGKYVFVESSDELKPAYTVTYDANGAASGSVPVDSSSPYFYSNGVTVLDNTGGLAKEGYEFSGWNTKADGTGTHYAPDSTFTIYSNTTLYAVWKVPHSHEYTYAVNTENAAQIIESCTCGHKETATLELDTTVSAVYTGSAIKPLKVTYSSGWAGDQNTAISYSNNTNAGTASGSVTIGGLTVTKSFTITKKSAEAPAAPTAQNSITYGAELSEVGLTAGWTWADGNTIPTVNNSGYTAYYTPADVTNLDWTAVDGWNASAGRVERTVAVTVNKSIPAYTEPTAITATYGDTLADVELPAGWTWKDTGTTSVGNAGTRTFKALYNPDSNNYITAEADIMLEVTKAAPEISAPTAKTGLEYSGSAMELINDGTVNGGEIRYKLGELGTYGTAIPFATNAGTYTVYWKVVGDSNHKDTAEQFITVTVADTTDPTGEILIKDNSWKKFLNWISFGLFCKENVDVIVTADGTGSAVDKVEYLFSATALNEENLPADGWKTAEGNNGTYTFAITAQNKGAVYVKITDAHGNVAVINSDGIVVYTDSSVTMDTVYFTYQSNEDVVIDLELNGNTVENVLFNGHEIAGHWSVDGNKLTLDADYLGRLVVLDNGGSYPVTVYFNPLGVETDKVELKDEFSLVIQKANGSVTNISDISKTYDDSPVSEPTFDKLGDGAATIEYKVKGADDSTYTTTAPSAAGDYVVRVTVAESKNYKAASATEEFTIGRATITDISVEQDGKLTYNGGDALTPVVVEKATSMNGQPVTFKYSTLQDGTYGSLPSFDKAGIYTVYYKATAPNHNETTGSFTVTVEKAIVTEATIASKPFNNSAQKADISDTDLYTVVKNDGGTAKGEYDVILKLKDAANYKWSTTESAEVTLKFVICAAENSWMTEPSISGWTYGQNANELAYAAKYGTVKVMYTGKANDGSDYNSESAPTKAGDYTATFTVEGTADYSGLSKQVNFTVAKATYDMTGAKWDYTAAFDYDGKEHTVTVIGLPSGVTVSGYEGNKAMVVGNYTAKVTFSYDGNNYNAPALADLTWSIKNDWTPTEYAVNGSGWMNQDFVISARDGYWISLAVDDTWSTELIFSDETADGSVTFYLKNDETGAISLAKTVNYKLDKTAPVGRVELDERTSWEEFVHNITFGLFYKDEVTVKVTANDILSDVAKIEYASSNEAKTLDEVMEIADWTEYNGSFGVTLEDAKKFVYFVRITDNAGNVTYLSTNGAEYDITAPVIECIENGKTYYTTQRFTVKESNLESVTVNGNPSMTFALGGNVDKEYVIVATDKADNTTTVTVTMKPISELSALIDTLTKDNVNSGNKQAVDDVKAAVAAVDTTNATDEEKAALKDIADKAAELEKVIEDTKAEIARITDEQNKINGDTVNSDDAPALERLAKDIKELLDSDNLTDAERTALTEDANDVAAMQKIVADTVAENERISDAVDSYDLTTVTSEDKDDLEQLLADINKQLESTNLTEEEISELNGDKKAVEDLLTKIKGTDELIDKLIGDVDDYSDDTVKSTDKDAIEQIIEDIDALLKTENLTDAEKMALEDAKDKAEGLLDTIDEATKATETENTEKVKDVTAENVTPEDKTDLEKAKEDLEKTLEDKGDNYTEDEKKAIEDEIKRIDDALEVIGNVEEVEELIDRIPENITKNDEDAIKAADDAYNALTDYEKTLVDEDAKKALDDAKTALAELNKPADPDSPQTGDNTNLWLWWLLLIVSATGVIILSAEQRKRKAMK